MYAVSYDVASSRWTQVLLDMSRALLEDVLVVFSCDTKAECATWLLPIENARRLAIWLRSCLLYLHPLP